MCLLFFVQNFQNEQLMGIALKRMTTPVGGVPDSTLENKNRVCWSIIYDLQIEGLKYSLFKYIF